MDAPMVRRGGGHAGHVWMTDVDDNDVVYQSCHFPGGDTMCGDASIVGKTTKARADAIRRAARAFWSRAALN